MRQLEQSKGNLRPFYLAHNKLLFWVVKFVCVNRSFDVNPRRAIHCSHSSVTNSNLSISLYTDGNANDTCVCVEAALPETDILRHVTNALRSLFMVHDDWTGDSGTGTVWIIPSILAQINFDPSIHLFALIDFYLFRSIS